MRIAVVSDTHSRYQTIETVVRRIELEKVDMILHCGDIEDAEAVWMFPERTHFVFGNCDWDKAAIRAAVQGTGASLSEPLGRIEIDGQAIAWLHGDDKKLLRNTVEGGEFDFLFYGHTHQADDRREGRTRVINPGALHRATIKSFLLFDVGAQRLESVQIE